MSYLSMFTIALGLSMDAFAASVSSGVAIRRMHVRHALLIAAFFGTFQALMPVLGWHAGHWAMVYVRRFDHWIAFALLAGVGVKMIIDSRRSDARDRNPLDITILFVLSIATSIDALAVGLSLSFVDVSIVSPVLIIGTVTFLMSFAGIYLGDRFGHLCEKKLEVFGGLILIGIGAKILVEHLFFAGCR